MKITINHDNIGWKDYFYYDESSTTCLRWGIDVGCGVNHSRLIRKKGDVAGTLRTLGGSGQVSLDKKSYLLHRIIWEIHFGKIKEGMVIDHFDGNPRNNKIVNLRAITHCKNSRNQNKRKNNSTGTTGVSLTSNGLNFYYVATWCDLESNLKRKYFSIDKFGDQVAMHLAIAHRQKMMVELNDSGAGYTVRHGK